MDMIQAYIEGFKKHYPSHNVEVKSKRQRGEWRFAVIINGDKGDVLLSEADMREATRMFNK
jgi:hypothetical protein